MQRLWVRHQVKDYATWRAVFDADAADRKKMGLHNGTIMHVQGDPNDLVIIFEVDDAEKMMAFMDESRARATAEKAGVIGEPTALVLDLIEGDVS
jgi:uncharacterized protein with GYD domain